MHDKAEHSTRGSVQECHGEPLGESRDDPTSSRERAEHSPKHIHSLVDGSSTSTRSARSAAADTQEETTLANSSAVSPSDSTLDSSHVQSFPGYEDDPPWARRSANEAGETTPRAARDITPTSPPGSTPVISDPAAAPSTPKELYQALLRFSKPTSAPREEYFSRLIRYHRSYPALQSTQSYNWLISITMTLGDLRVPEDLLNEMHDNGIAPNVETEKLRARLKIRQGHWLEAWEEQKQKLPMPLPVWLEFLGSVEDGTRHVVDYHAVQMVHLRQAEARRLKGQANDGLPGDAAPPTTSSQDSAAPDSSTGDPASVEMPGFHDLNAVYGDWFTFAQQHVASAAQWEEQQWDSSVGFIDWRSRNALRMWARRNRRDALGIVVPRERAVRLSPPDAATEEARYQALMQYFPPLTAEQQARQPPRVVEMIVKWLLRVNRPNDARTIAVNYLKTLPATLSPQLHTQCLNIIHPLLTAVKPGLKGYFAAHKTLRGLLKEHPALRPDATTLVHLLCTLRDARECGATGYTLVTMFRLQYGPAVVDERVRWRLMWLALKERNIRVARSMLAEHDRALAAQAQRPEDGPAARGLRPSFRELLPARHLEEYWTVLRERYERLCENQREFLEEQRKARARVYRKKRREREREAKAQATSDSGD